MNRHKKTKNTIWNEFFNSDCQWINHIDTEKRGQIHTVCGLPSIFPFRFYNFFFFFRYMFFGFLPLYFREFSFLSWNPFVSNEPTATTCVSLFRPPVFYCGDWQVFGLTFWRAFGFFLSFLPVPQSWLSEWWRLWRSKLWRSPSYTSVSSLQSIWIRKPVRQILWFTQKKQDTVTAAFEFYFLSPFLFCFFLRRKKNRKRKTTPLVGCWLEMERN